MSVTAIASWNADRESLVLDDPGIYRAGLKRMKLGAGERVVIHVEREQDAIAAHQRKFYFGHIIRPLVDANIGYAQDEWHEMFKGAFMPDDGRTSITQLTYDEMRAFSERCEQYARERFSDAFALLDRKLG